MEQNVQAEGLAVVEGVQEAAVVSLPGVRFNVAFLTHALQACRLLRPEALPQSQHTLKKITWLVMVQMCTK